METKYYTPTIEELHHNFECEIFFENQWNSSVIQNQDGDFCVIKGFPKKLVKFIITEKTIEDKNIRVKLLEKEDIESLEWKDDEDGFFNFGAKYQLLFSSNLVTIYFKKYKSGGVKDYSILFHGFIKNKTELYRIMQQTGILQKEDGIFSLELK